jgi:virulence-associated protein VagC
MATTRLFRNGNAQAVRIPAAGRAQGEQPAPAVANAP